MFAKSIDEFRDFWDNTLVNFPGLPPFLLRIFRFFIF